MAWRRRKPRVGSQTRRARLRGERQPLWARKQIIDKKTFASITLPGLQDLRVKATDRGDLQLRMQGNAFLGGVFSVSPMLTRVRITPGSFGRCPTSKYVKKFGKLGEAVVVSNMEVMTKGFELVREIKLGEMEAADRSTAARQGAAADRDAREHRRQRRMRHGLAPRFRLPRISRHVLR